MPNSQGTLWSEVRGGVSKLIQRVPPEYELAIHRVRNQYNPVGVLYSRDPAVIARWVESSPHDDYLVETELVRAGSQEVADVCGRPERRPWAACFLIEVRGCTDHKEKQGRLIAACGVLTCMILRAYPKVHPFIVQRDTGLWCLYFDPGMAALPVCCSAVVQDRIKNTALRTLHYLDPGVYSINPTSSFEMPRKASGWDLRHEDIQAILERRRGMQAA